MKSNVLFAAFVAFNPTIPFDPDTGDCFEPSAVVDFANRDSNRITGNITRVEARSTPFSNILEGGVLENVSDTVRAIVQEEAYLGYNMAAPEFTNSLELCGTGGETAEVGSTEFTETLQGIRGRGPRVCVKTTRAAFAASYAAAEDSLQKQLIQLKNADIRHTLATRSGSKLFVRSDRSFEQMYSGHFNAIDQEFDSNGDLPDSAINFKLLKYAGDFLREDLLVNPFELQGSEVLKFIGSQQIIEKFRSELNLRDDQRALASGSFKIGKDAITGYTFEGPYRGIAFGTDTQPLRFNVLDEEGQPVYIDPLLRTVVTKGAGARINPAWVRARFEVGFLVGKGSFRRRVPTAYAGHAGFKFPPQLANAKLEFAVVRDNNCNLFQDFGQHLYQIERSYRPERPHAVMAIAYKRCVEDFGLVECDDMPNYSSTESL